MTKINVYSETGKKKEGITLPKELTADSNIALLAQAIRVFENRKHPGISRVKSRGEITSSKHKIYKQKGTGGARHGARSAPLFVGGGIAHGPSGNKRVLAMPAKMRAKALQIALGMKAAEGTMVLVENFAKVTKAQAAQNLFASIVEAEKYTNNRVTVALSDKNREAMRALRNLKNVSTVSFKNLNAHAVCFGGTLVVDADALNENTKSEKTENKKVKVEKTLKAEPKKVATKKVPAKKPVKKSTKKQ